MVDQAVSDDDTASNITGAFFAGIQAGANKKFPATLFNVTASNVLVEDAEDQGPITGGASITSKSLGTQSSGTLTLDMGDRPMQHYTNGGAHTLAPGSVNGMIYLDITNNGSAGAITTSGWTKVVGTFTTTSGHKFRCSCSVGNAGSLLTIQAMQ